MSLSYYKRSCPGCDKELSYKSPVSFKFAQQNEQKCKDCCERKNRISPELVQQILDLNSQGILNREIARTLGIHHRSVGNYLKEHGREQNFANQPIDMVSDNEAKCRKCDGVKNVDEFQFGRKGQKYQYKFSYCNECRKKQNYLSLNGDVSKFLGDRFNRTKRRAKQSGIPCTITKDEFINQYNYQNGLCFYTGRKLICEVGSELHRDSLSIDKIVPHLGYSVGNFVFTTHKINTCKGDLSLEEIVQWMPDWFDRIKFFSTEHSMDYVKNIKIKKLITINGCSAINRIIDAELLTDDAGGQIIIIENPDDQLKFITIAGVLPYGTYDVGGTDVEFQAKATWLWTTERGLSIQLAGPDVVEESLI